MRLVTFQIEEKEQVGVLSDEGRRVIAAEALGLPYTTMNELIEGLTAKERQWLAEAASKGEGIPLSQVRLCAPIPEPKQDIICLGQNYLEHARESARYKKEAFGGANPYPVYFAKRVNRAIADGEDVPSHRNLTEKLDYEAELAVIIGRDVRNLKREEAGNYIFGYTILNDISARDVQTNHKQWYFGKSLEGTTPMGPCIVTADEIAYPPALRIQCFVNGELRQDSRTDQFIFDIGYVIEELSAGMTLKAGTIISTGTPAGVGMGFVPPKFLQPGDVIECRIEKIGTLTNTVC